MANRVRKTEGARKEYCRARGVLRGAGPGSSKVNLPEYRGGGSRDQVAWTLASAVAIVKSALNGVLPDSDGASSSAVPAPQCSGTVLELFLTPRSWGRLAVGLAAASLSALSAPPPLGKGTIEALVGTAAGIADTSPRCGCSDRGQSELLLASSLPSHAVAGAAALLLRLLAGGVAGDCF